MIDRIPLVPGAPLLGALPAFLMAPLELAARARAVGDITRIGVLGANVVLLHHPVHIDHVLRAQHARYRKGGPFWSSVAAILGNGLPVSEGEPWKRQRRLVQPQFQRQRLAELAPAIHARLAQSVDWAEVGSAWSSVDLQPHVQHLTMDVVAAAMFGSGVSRDGSREVAAAFRTFVRGMLWSMLLEGVPWIPGRRRAVSDVRSHVARMIEQRRAHPDGEGCVLDWMIAQCDPESGAGMSDQQLLDETVSLFVAGFETTASGLQWSLHYLAEHPRHYLRIREQADAYLTHSAGGAVLAELTHARWVMQEALRLYPPVWWIPRVAVVDDEIGGYRIPAGTMVAAVVYTAQRHPALWAVPDDFEPERFDPARGAERPRSAWLPFGLGPRGCVGQELALIEAQLALSLIAQRYDLAAVPGARARPNATVLLAPEPGMRVQLRRRRLPARLRASA